jgi:8-oxo-dGTP pyrophosphatase MutT (NUDIX family)
VLLATSRQTKHWIIPRGWPIKGLKPCKSAAREAYEEAGIRGRVARRPLGRYLYEKQDGKARFLCEVQVFPLLVKRQLEKWPECEQRTVKWFGLSEAAAMLDELRELILGLQNKQSGSSKKFKRG